MGKGGDGVDRCGDCTGKYRLAATPFFLPSTLHRRWVGIHPGSGSTLGRDPPWVGIRLGAMRIHLQKIDECTAADQRGSVFATSQGYGEAPPFCLVPLSRPSVAGRSFERYCLAACVHLGFDVLLRCRLPHTYRLEPTMQS